MEIIVSILILLGLGLVLGQIFEQFRFAAVAGEILGGFILGPAVLGVIRPTAELTSISEIALFFIVLLIGIEITTSLITNNYRGAVPLTFFSFGVPVVLMLALLHFFFGNTMATSVIVAVSIGVPSISIISVLVKRYGLLQNSSGQIILASTVFSDLIAFIALSAFLNQKDFLFKIAAILLFIVALFVADFFIHRNSAALVRVFSRLHATEQGDRVIFGVIIILGLVAATFFQLIGFTFVLGAFFAGMIISEVILGQQILGILTRTLNRMNDSFFIPVYFTIAGLNVIFPTPFFIVVLASLLLITGGAVAILTRWIAPRIAPEMPPGRLMGFMGSRGAVGVVIAGTALGAAVISYDLYSVILLGTVIMALFFPLFTREKNQA
jgi:Kef-type K+ transport system membrane component KefB